MRYARWVSVGNYERKELLARCKYKWKNNIKIDVEGWDMKMNEFNLIWIGSIFELLWIRCWNFGINRLNIISWSVTQILASQYDLFTMKMDAIMERIRFPFYVYLCCIQHIAEDLYYGHEFRKILRSNPGLSKITCHIFLSSVLTNKHPQCVAQIRRPPRHKSGPTVFHA